jgi:glycosyltransferase involved in cell wall biosynthesis
VQCLLATCNGERFLEQQLESILTQEGVQVHIVAADDASTDRTVDVLRSWSRNAPLTLIGHDRVGGSLPNFRRLLDVADGCYIAFADQDDVWEKSKLKVLYRSASEKQLALTYSDMSIIDENGRVHSDSFFSTNVIDPHRQRFENILLQNVASGNASMFTGDLLDLVRPIPTQATGHDWWLALVTAAFGRLEYVDQPLVRYRQHQRNQEGSKGRPLRRARTALQHGHRDVVRRATQRKHQQAAAFKDRYAASLAPDQRSNLDFFLRMRLNARNSLSVIRELRRRNLLYGDWQRNAIWLGFELMSGPTT